MDRPARGTGPPPDPSIRTTSLRPLASAGFLNIATESSTRSARLKSTDSRSRWPDSILEKSRISLTTWSRCFPAPAQVVEQGSLGVDTQHPDPDQRSPANHKGLEPGRHERAPDHLPDSVRLF